MTDTERLKALQEQYNKLEDIHNYTVKQYEALQKQYLVVVDLAKKNSDCYEYCLTSLEKEIEELKKQKQMLN